MARKQDRWLKAFAYSGSKTSLLDVLPRPPADTQTVVELFAGSCAYALNSGLPWLAFEVSPPLIKLWRWLETVDADTLRSLDEWSENFDIRDANLPPGVEEYYRINSCGLYKGTFVAYRYYAQHRLPIEKTIQALPAIQRGLVVAASFENYEYTEGDFVFVDPPYAKGAANYVAPAYDVDKLKTVLDSIPDGRFIVTLGEPEPRLGLDFIKIGEKVTSAARSFSSVKREEWIATERRGKDKP